MDSAGHSVMIEDEGEKVPLGAFSIRPGKSVLTYVINSLRLVAKVDIASSSQELDSKT